MIRHRILTVSVPKEVYEEVERRRKNLSRSLFVSKILADALKLPIYPEE